MRRTLSIGLLGLATLVAPRGASAADLSIEHFAPVPCSIACAYWEVAETAGFDVCASDFPNGSFDETIMRLTSETGFVEIETRSVVDYDTFLCTNTEPRVHINDFADPIEPQCAGVAGNTSVAVGCPEHLYLNWHALQAFSGEPADEFVILSYNWSDYAPLPITITGPAEILDDTYEGVTV